MGVPHFRPRFLPGAGPKLDPDVSPTWIWCRAGLFLQYDPGREPFYTTRGDEVMKFAYLPEQRARQACYYWHEGTSTAGVRTQSELFDDCAGRCCLRRLPKEKALINKIRGHQGSWFAAAVAPGPPAENT